jgi:hypothetical protein
VVASGAHDLIDQICVHDRPPLMPARAGEADSTTPARAGRKAPRLAY